MNSSIGNADHQYRYRGKGKHFTLSGESNDEEFDDNGLYFVGEGFMCICIISCN